MTKTPAEMWAGTIGQAEGGAARALIMARRDVGKLVRHYKLNHDAAEAVEDALADYLQMAAWVAGLRTAEQQAAEVEAMATAADALAKKIADITDHGDSAVGYQLYKMGQPAEWRRRWRLDLVMLAAASRDAAASLNSMNIPARPNTGRPSQGQRDKLIAALASIYDVLATEPGTAATRAEFVEAVLMLCRDKLKQADVEVTIPRDIPSTIRALRRAGKR